MEKIAFWEKDSLSSMEENSCPILCPGVWIFVPQNPSMTQVNTVLTYYIWKIHLNVILSPVHRFPMRVVLLSDFTATILYTFLISTTNNAYFALLVFLDLFGRNVQGRSSYSCSFIKPARTSAFLCTNSLFSILTSCIWSRKTEHVLRS